MYSDSNSKLRGYFDDKELVAQARILLVIWVSNISSNQYVKVRGKGKIKFEIE